MSAQDPFDPVVQADALVVLPLVRSPEFGGAALLFLLLLLRFSNKKYRAGFLKSK